MTDSNPEKPFFYNRLYFKRWKTTGGCVSKVVEI